MLERIRGWRTLGSSAMCAVAGISLLLQDQLSALGLDLRSLIGEVVPTKYVGGVLFAIACWFAYCRFITATGWGRKE